MRRASFPHIQRTRTAARVLGAAAPALLAVAAAAQEQAPDEALPRQRVVVTGQAERADGAFATRADRRLLQRRRALAGDTARLLEDIPGLSVYGAGGVSSLPVLHGLADDRLRTQVDGMDLVASCPNHMNSPLSYIDPASVGSVRVYAGVTPVSVGGDSIGGTIQVEAAPPSFAEGDELLREARAGAQWRSNGRSRGGHAAATLATASLSLAFEAAATRRDNQRAAAAFKPEAAGTEGGAPLAGDLIGSSAYDAANQSLGLAWRQGDHLLQLKLGTQHIGFEGFANQRMDMTGNRSTQLNLRYSGRWDWGRLTARAYRQRVEHEMDMGPDRYRYGYGMPMDTESTTRGALLQADLDVGDGALLRLGAERQTYVLYDWWPPVGGSMGPRAFWNIDFGQRHHGDLFVEWESAPGERLGLLAGLRGSRVTTDAAPVQGYDNGLGAIWGNEATAFNARERRREDRLWDASLIARFAPDDATRLEAGYAHKSRAPNLYQRYPWSTQPMAALMNNFVGDGNGYIGQPDLRPEIADTVALTAERHAAERAAWSVKLTLYRTEVRDYIDARRCDFGQCSAANVSAGSGFVLLQYANQRARLQGLDLSGHWQPPLPAGSGELTLSWMASVVAGRNRDTGDGLYNIMPPNLKLALEHRAEAWTTRAEWSLVAAKTRVSQVRNEVPTAGHGLVNLWASRAFAHARIDLGIENLFNRAYAPPLGGAYLGQGRSMTSAGVAWGVPMPGLARSLSAALTLNY